MNRKAQTIKNLMWAVIVLLVILILLFISSLTGLIPPIR